MTWLYIIAAILAQVIVAVLLISYIDRGSKQGVPEPQPQKEPEPMAEPVKEEQKVDAPQMEQEISSAIGASTFDYGQFRDMIKEVMLPIVKECIATAMEARECEFVGETKKNTDTEPDARMSKEQEQESWKDNRDVEERLLKEDDTPAMPNPLADGTSFDEIAHATVMVETPGNPTPKQHRFIVKVFHQLEGTQLEDLMPDSLREKVYACHREAESNPDSFKDKVAEMDIAEKSASSSEPPAAEKPSKTTKPDEEAKPQRSYVPLNSFANPNKHN